MTDFRTSPETESLAECFDADELRGYSPIRNFTPQERRIIAAALRRPRVAQTPAARIDVLEATLRSYVNDFCEGWCRDSQPRFIHKAMFEECSGCRALAALSDTSTLQTNREGK